MAASFSSLQRSQIAAELESSSLDMLIIGGGITGAGILLDAVSRGMRVGLIEMQDFAAGTSSRSTKLVHGGLRYLKQFDVGLVAEVGKERAIVYENAPHVTTPVWMLLPIVKGGHYGWHASSIGIFVYDMLAGVKKAERRQMLDTEGALAKEPLLRQAGLLGAGYYVEYRTDDARLTLEALKAGVDRGGMALNYVRAEELIYKEHQVVGVKAHDSIRDTTFSIFAKTIVNATGPWVDELREQDGSKTGKYLHHTKGVHIVIDQSRFPLHNAVYFDIPDGRMLFAIPRAGKTYVGTTDTDFHEDLKKPRTTKADIDYLIQAVNHMFPSVCLTPADVEATWAGVRPLIHEVGKSPSEISRKDEVFVSPSGLITIAGGKLTGYRKMAQKVVSLVANRLTAGTTERYPACYTERIPLSGGDVGGSVKWAAFAQSQVAVGKKLGLTESTASKLVQRYGTNIEQIYALMIQHVGAAEAAHVTKDVYATLVYAIESELCETLVDYFVRRTGSMLFEIQFVYQWQSAVGTLMAQLLAWDDAQSKRQQEQLQEAIEEATVAL